MSNIFLDTNILVYGFDDANPGKKERSLDLLLKARDAGHFMVISTQVLQEYYNTLTRKLLVDRRTAKREMLLLTRFHVVVMTPDLISIAADIQDRTSISFWDSLVVSAAQAAKCDELWTEDLNAGQMFGTLKVVNPLTTV